VPSRRTRRFFRNSTFSFFLDSLVARVGVAAANEAIDVFIPKASDDSSANDIAR